EKPNLFNPIHEDDQVRQLPKLLEAASVPATITNWAGAPASIEEWCGHLSDLTGLEAKFEETPDTIGSVTCDLTRMPELVGDAPLPLREGIEKMVAAREPELLKTS